MVLGAALVELFFTESAAVAAEVGVVVGPVGARVVDEEGGRVAGPSRNRGMSIMASGKLTAIADLITLKVEFSARRAMMLAGDWEAMLVVMVYAMSTPMIDF